MLDLQIIAEMFDSLVVPTTPRDGFLIFNTAKERTANDRARSRIWAKKNPERKRELNRKHNRTYREVHRDRILADRRTKRAANRDKVNERRREARRRANMVKKKAVESRFTTFVERLEALDLLRQMKVIATGRLLDEPRLPRLFEGKEPDELAARIDAWFYLHHQGWNVAAIADLFGCSPRVVEKGLRWRGRIG